jgi:hypothetical protein
VADGLIGLERLGLASGAVEGEHQLPEQSLSQRVFPHERFELAHEVGVAPPGEVALDPLLETGEAKLLQTLDLCLGEALIGELGQRRPAPERERLLELRLVLQAPEASEIELVGPHV